MAVLRDGAGPRSSALLLSNRGPGRRPPDLRWHRLDHRAGEMEHNGQPGHLCERTLFHGTAREAGTRQRHAAAEPTLYRDHRSTWNELRGVLPTWLAGLGHNPGERQHRIRRKLVRSKEKLGADRAERR